MAIVYRLTKGSPLTYAETDENFRYLLSNMSASIVHVTGSVRISGSVSGSFSGSFEGDGSGLTGIPVGSITGVVKTGLGDSTSQTVEGSLVLTGDLTAEQYIISSSVVYYTESFSSGSTKFGDSMDDDHEFTGSVLITGSVDIVGPMSQGSGATATGTSAFSQGTDTVASNTDAHAEGVGTKASGLYSHAEGYYTLANNSAAHAEGTFTSASGFAAHAEGSGSEAKGGMSHAQGIFTLANKQGSFSSGFYTLADHTYAFTHGAHLTSSHASASYLGQYNSASFYASNYHKVFEIGAGASNSRRVNAFGAGMYWDQAGSSTSYPFIILPHTNGANTRLQTSQYGANPPTGSCFFDFTSKTLNVYNGTTWSSASLGG